MADGTTITVPNLNNYNTIIFYNRSEATSGSYEYSIVKLSELSSSRPVEFCVYPNNYYYGEYRIIQNTNTNQLTFSIGYCLRQGNLSSGIGVCVPLKIYGINLN